MLHSQKDIEKCAIGATDGDIGQVKDLYFDDHAWAIRYFIVDTGTWLSGRKVLISPIAIERLDWSAHKLQVAITQEQVEHSPIIDTDKPVSRQHEMLYLGYYGYPTYWDGIGMWGNGMLPMGLYPGYAELPGGNAARDENIEQNARAEQASHHDDDPHLRSCKAVIGYHIRASDGEVGHVDGFLIDDQSWAIRYLVVNTSNWWIGHQVLITPEQISGVHWPDRTVTVDLSREAVKAAPAYDALVELNP
ncbi:MAG: PRC-barrel domain-containing protein [Pseudomonas sp.]|uniref:PRC-barrel domain-containing protein n=1 Tax=Pseudomonas sp. TaxID=306 RepID=UPI003981F57C